jgi:hypothetical protein
VALGEEAAEVFIERFGGRWGDGGEAVDESLRGETGDGEARHRGGMGWTYVLRKSEKITSFERRIVFCSVPTKTVEVFSLYRDNAPLS